MTSTNEVSIAGLYLGTTIHVDDVRSLSQKATAAEYQVSTLSEFTTIYELQMNASKTKINCSPVQRTPHPFSIGHHCWDPYSRKEGGQVPQLLVFFEFWPLATGLYHCKLVCC